MRHVELVGDALLLSAYAFRERRSRAPICKRRHYPPAFVGMTDSISIGLRRLCSIVTTQATRNPGNFLTKYRRSVFP